MSLVPVTPYLSVPSVLNVREFSVRLANRKTFNTREHSGHRGSKTEADSTEINHALIDLRHPGNRRGGLRAAAGGLIRNGERGNFVPRHIHGSHQRDLAGSIGVENGDADRLSCFRHEPKLQACAPKASRASDPP